MKGESDIISHRTLSALSEWAPVRCLTTCYRRRLSHEACGNTQCPRKWSEPITARYVHTSCFLYLSLSAACVGLRWCLLVGFFRRSSPCRYGLRGLAVGRCGDGLRRRFVRREGSHGEMTLDVLVTTREFWRGSGEQVVIYSYTALAASNTSSLPCASLHTSGCTRTGNCFIHWQQNPALYE